MRNSLRILFKLQFLCSTLEESFNQYAHHLISEWIYWWFGIRCRIFRFALMHYSCWHLNCRTRNAVVILSVAILTVNSAQLYHSNANCWTFLEWWKFKDLSVELVWGKKQWKKICKNKFTRILVLNLRYLIQRNRQSCIHGK